MNKKKLKKITPHHSLLIIPNSSNGFTLIELLIATTIVAIAAVVGIINLSNYRARSDLNHAGQEIVTFLRDAQSRSISQEATSTQGSGGRWGVHFENPATSTDFYDLFWGAVYTTGTVVSRATLPASVQFDIPASGSSSTIVFAPLTGLPNATTTIKISSVSSAAVSSTITVNSNGQIQY